MGKKIFAVLLLLSFTCAGLQAQNNQNRKSTARVEKDVNILQYNPVRLVSDSASRARTMQELALKDQGVVSIATIISSYKPFILPPLDELFERAKNNPEVVYRKHEMDFAWRDVMTARRDWMNWIHGNAAYSYGKYNTNLFYQQTNIPTSDTYSSQNASYYLLGGSFQVNLFDVFNLNNKVQQRKDRYQATEYQYQSAWEGVMEKISKSYYTLQYLLPTVAHGIQWAKLAELAYEDAKLDFIAGRVGTNALFECESQYFRSVEELTVTLREISVESKFLELITNSKIIPDGVDLSNGSANDGVSFPANSALSNDVSKNGESSRSSRKADKNKKK